MVAVVEVAVVVVTTATVTGTGAGTADSTGTLLDNGAAAAGTEAEAADEPGMATAAVTAVAETGAVTFADEEEAPDAGVAVIVGV